MRGETMRLMRLSAWVNLRTSFLPREFNEYLNTQRGNWPRKIHGREIGRLIWYSSAVVLFVFLFLSPAIVRSSGQAGLTQNTAVAVGAQYDSPHVYAAPGYLDGFVKSFVVTFGGQSSKRTVTNVLPVPSSTEFQYIWTPVGTLSVFAFQTPIPYPFGQERTGYLVTDMDRAIKAARAAGAEVIVEPFKDPIGMDAVIQWPGGVKMQLYWHFKASTNPPLGSIPDNRVYVSPDAADAF